MEVVTVSPKFQVVIPLSVRQSLGIKPGHKVQVILYEGRIELIPLKPIKKMRGFLNGIDTTIEREADRVRTSLTHRVGLNTWPKSQTRIFPRPPSRIQPS